MIRTALSALALALAAALAMPAHADTLCRGDGHSHVRRSICAPIPPRSAQLVQIDLVDRDSGQTLPEYRHRGQDWVPGTPGHRYAVRLTNTTGGRVLVVLSVDGVNAVTGQTAAPSQAGYVLEPWETAEIAGWRKSLDDIAQFVFTDLQDSYAARTGRPDNVGVVGVAVFRERTYRPPLRQAPIAGADAARARPLPAPPAAAANADRAMAAEAMPRQLGTGHGDREWSPIGQTEFTRATSRPEQVSQVRYDSTRALVALGVIPRRDWRSGPRGPNAFPNGFVPDPPRW
ncbi:hypothetical protein [Thermomonas sp.]|uniref:hypothetical protein n=1 Tax=Thermomonas sp. TaxID=1971895 RepID=UPI0026023E33|nr:hypothetical protein [Thermomonas sp.]MCO5055496.1 hypothetical protein [Thermomonas sp.]